LSLTEPDKKDPYGLAGKRGRSPFSPPRFRRLRSAPLFPKWFVNGVIDFAIDIWYSKPDARAKKAARRRR